MKLSRKGRYGLKAMFELSLRNNDTPISLKLIAKNQDIPEQYLEQLFSKLKKSELVKSIRGAQGGYLLAKKPIEISVGDVLLSVEGPIYLSDCIVHGSDCENSDICCSKSVFEKIKIGIENVLESITLQDMIDDYNEKDTHKIM